MAKEGRVDQSQSLPTPGGRPRSPCCDLLLSLCEHRALPLQLHLRQEEEGAQDPCQETQAEGPPGGRVLHGYPVSIWELEDGKNDHYHCL